MWFINKKRRESLRAAHSLLERAYNIVTFAKDEEENAIDNVPENLQSSDRYEQMEDAAELLSDAEDCIETAINKIADVCHK